MLWDGLRWRGSPPVTRASRSSSMAETLLAMSRITGANGSHAWAMVFSRIMTAPTVKLTWLRIRQMLIRYKAMAATMMATPNSVTTVAGPMVPSLGLWYEPD